MSTIYQKIKDAAAKKLQHKMPDGSMMDGASHGPAKHELDRKHEHGEDTTEVFPNSNDGKNVGTTTVNTGGNTTIEGAKVEKIETDNDKYLKSFEKGFAKDPEGFSNIEDYRLKKEGKYKDEVVEGEVKASFVPDSENKPPVVTKDEVTNTTPPKPMLYNNDAYSVRTNQKGIEIADKKQIKKLSKLEKKRDGKTFFGLFNKKSELKDSAKNRAIDAQIASVEEGGVPTEARNNIFKTGLFNRGTGGKSQPGTPGTSETSVTETKTEGSNGLVDWNAGDETSGSFDPETGTFNKNVPISDLDKKIIKASNSSTMTTAAAVYNPSKIKMGNGKSFKMGGMKFKG